MALKRLNLDSSFGFSRRAAEGIEYAGKEPKARGHTKHTVKRQECRFSEQQATVCAWACKDSNWNNK